MNGVESESVSESAFGRLLRQFRMRAGLSQEQLAQRAHVSTSAIGAIEQGIRRAPYLETVVLLAQGLALSNDDLALLEKAAVRARTRTRRSTNAKPVPALDVPVRTSAPPLSIPLSTFIDRPERAELDSYIKKHRLLTVTGPGGIGKTRTTVEALDRRTSAEPNPPWLIDLSGISDDATVPGAIASAIGVTFLPEQDPLEALADEFSSRNDIIVLDNAEKLVRAVGIVVSRLLDRCECLRIVVTSREPLGLASEVVYRLPPLTIHDTAHVASAAVALFLDRASTAETRLQPDERYVTVAREICRRLDGIPLAIELAAPSAATLGIDELLSRIGENYVLAGGNDLPKRHRTLTSTIAWSYDTLSPLEALLFRRLSIFSSTVSLEAAESLCADEDLPALDIAELLGSLVRKSLVNLSRVDGVTLHSMLEPIRRFAAARLAEDGERGAAHIRS